MCHTTLSQTQKKALFWFHLNILAAQIFQKLVEKYTLMRIIIYLLFGVFIVRLCRWFRFAQLAKGKKFRP
jgi:hypothetical protein